jgi:hypothetical protein
MNRFALLSVLLSALFVVTCLGCGEESKKEDQAGCSATDQAECVAADSDSGYGKCVWVNAACAAPTAETSCATYPDEASCTALCVWKDGVCTGDNAGPGLPCSNYTTQVACEIPCAWAAAACIVDPCDGKAEADCTATDSLNGYGKCIWADGACAAPSVESACATYPDQASCEAPCTWEADACTSDDDTGPGLPCSNYTTKVACEIPCGWSDTACVPMP